AVADLLRTRGWYVDRHGPPPSIHLTVNAVHATTVDAFIADLRSAVAETAARPAAQSGDAGSYGTLE
ncbi:MAG: aspartate aminotransferase family protein, partial [Actinomycetota bacterium]